MNKTEDQEIIVSPSIFHSTGEMGKLIQNYDWAKTSLGPQHLWSESLKNVVNLMLSNRFPMLLWWGKDYIQMYNDAYRPILGLKHPSPGLGYPGNECWEEIWDIIGPLVDTPFRGGPATWMDDILLKINRNNFNEETHFTIAYSPVPDKTVPGGIGGVLATVKEITQEIIAKRQMETLRKLGKGMSSTLSEDEVYEQATAVLGENLQDIPFAFVHKINNATHQATLTSVTGISANHPEISQTISFRNPQEKWRSFAQAARETVIITAQLDVSAEDLPTGYWDISPFQFAYLPVRGGKRDSTVAIITIALNPYRKFDDSYANFLELVADQISFGVTNAMAYDQEKKRAEALAELDRAKTIFFSNVSHEFRTPLTLILSPLHDVLLSSGTAEIANVPIENIELIHRNALRLQKLVNTLLDFSRIEAGRMRASFKATDIAKLTMEITSNFRSAIEKAGLRFTVHCSPISEPIYIDNEMWEKIVLNLISNAFKFTQEGEIIIDLQKIENYVELKVKDTGIGIGPEDLSKVFERFHRIPHTQSRTHEGSGIGLALVQELVKLHGGRIQVRSELNKGTEFSVLIPVGRDHLQTDQIQVEKDPAESTAITPDVFREEALRWLPEEGMKYVSPESIKEKANRQDKPHVILVDDNADMRDYIKSILNEYCEVATVANGTMAFDLINDIKPDLVISDIMMPGLDGFELLEKIRNHPALRAIPVILLSARAGEEAKVEGLYLGADDYIIKPFTRNELIARVNSNIQLSRVRKEVAQAVRYSEAQLRALVTATSDVIYRMNRDWTIMWRLDGRNFLQDTGEAISNWEDKYIFEDDKQRVRDAIETSIQNKTLFQLEHRVIRKNGSMGWTFSRAVPIIDEEGEIFEWFGAASDITARKVYETDLEDRVEDRTRKLNEANSALQSSNQDLQQFAHVASHDLKEPVRKIKTFAHRVLDDEQNLITEKSKSYLNRLLTSAERMSTMIDGVLTYSSLKGTALEFSRVDLNEIIEEIMAELELVIHQKGALIHFGRLPVVHGGRLLLYQLFYNLISNALKFSHAERTPEIAITAEVVAIGNKRWHIINVSDNGIGFDESNNEKIFETFSRLNSKDKYEGTGLGLSLCRKIVDRHQGVIYATGLKNKGANFIIELPE